MDACVVRMVPVFVEQRARNLVLVRINNMTLAMFTIVSTGFAELASYIQSFESNLEEDAFQLPREVSKT